MKFSIRDLLLVTLIVAILAAWWVDRSRLAEEIGRLRNLHFWGPKLRLSDIDPDLLNILAPAPKLPWK